MFKKHILLMSVLLGVQGLCYAGVETYSPDAIRTEMQNEMFEEELNRDLFTKPFTPDKAKKQKQADDKQIIEDLKKDIETPEAYNPKFKLNKIVFEGNKVYKTKTLEKFVEPLIGQEIEINDVLKIADIVTKKYNYDGYITSYAYIPEQDVIDGVIKIRVVESKVKAIQIENNRWERDLYFKQVLFAPHGVKKNKIFNINTVDATMKTVNNMDYLKTKFSVKRDNETDETIIKADVKDRFPVKFNVAYDNHGRYYIGEQRARLTLMNENLTGLGDKIYGGVALSSGTTGVLSGYEIPVSPWGTKLAFDYDYTNIRMGRDLSSIGLKGKSTNYGLRLIQPIVKNSSTNIDASVGLSWTNTSSTVQNIKISDYALTVLRAGIMGTHDDNYGRSFASINGDFGINTSHTKGIDSYASPNTVFQKYSASAIRLQRIPLKKSYLVFRIAGQYAPSPLYPSEQMQLGGYSTVRGYETGAVLGDYGANGSLELRTPIPYLENILPNKIKSFSDNIKLLAFYDFGYFGSHKNPYGYGSNFIHSTGLGLNIFCKNGISLNFAAGVPLAAREFQRGSVRVHFSLSSDIDRLIYHKFEKETL